MRPDLSNSLVHFTKGDTDEDAFRMLKKILAEKRLLAGNSLIRGGHHCVCFSETPLPALKRGLVNAKGFSRYSKFGLLFHKREIFALGGRPVIYQPESDFGFLPAALQWRHVRLELTTDPQVDFSWEREWRLPMKHLDFEPESIAVILPDSDFLNRLDEEICSESFYNAWHYQQILGEGAWLYDTGNPWQMKTLREF